ncbi:MAG: hypothetical protein MZW92_13730 [Comamonadaceae bacterium]|nr:hypothetical protein [Comamonadaceae bacterium]
MKIVDDDGQRAAVGRQAVRRAAWCAAAGSCSGYFKARGRRPRGAGRLVPDRRRRDDRPERLHADHRPRQGRDQVRRRVDQLDRPREHRRSAHPEVADGRRRSACAIPSGTSGRCWSRCRRTARTSRAMRCCSSSQCMMAKWLVGPTTWSASSSMPLGGDQAEIHKSQAARAVHWATAPEPELSEAGAG